MPDALAPCGPSSKRIGRVGFKRRDTTRMRTTANGLKPFVSWRDTCRARAPCRLWASRLTLPLSLRHANAATLLSGRADVNLLHRDADRQRTVRATMNHAAQR